MTDLGAELYGRADKQEYQLFLAINDIDPISIFLIGISFAH